MKQRDKDWADRIRRGDQTAEREMVQEYGARLLYFARRKLSSYHADCEDILQDTLETALQKLRRGEYDPEKGALGSYLYGIMHKLVKNYHKKTQQKRNREVTIEGAEGDDTFAIENKPSDDPDPLEVVIINEEREIFIKELRKLPPNLYEILSLVYNDGLTIKPISKRLRKPPTKVSQLKSKASAQVRENIRKKYDA